MYQMKNQKKKFKSVIRRIIWIPMVAMIGIWAVTMTASIYSLLNVQQRTIERNVNALQISLNQLENTLDQIEKMYINYINEEECHAYLSRCTVQTPKEDMLVYEGKARFWVNKQANMFDFVQTAFVYYENTGFIQFRGISNFEVQSYMRRNLLRENKGTLNHWILKEIGEKQYLMYIFNYKNFYAGEWISVDDISDTLGLRSDVYLGRVYLMDMNHVNTMSDRNLNSAIAGQTENQREFLIDGNTYYNYTVSGQNINLYLGILIKKTDMFTSVPFETWVIFGAAFLSVFGVCVVVLWLRRRIADPVKDLNDAMRIIADGNVDYRLQPPMLKYENEFDRLANHFNDMMDKLDEVQFKLYETTIKEQQTELKYISQQIRPHFILNALNIIYTYDETEFSLVKKMVMYLTAYFRYIVNLKVDFVEVWQELDHIKNYLNIQKERYPDRFDYFVEYEAKTKNMLIPPLIIQTFVENCVKYGMLDDKLVFFYVLVSVKDNRITLFIADTGHGFSDEVLEKLNDFIQTRQPRNDLGVGIQNAIERLDILYDHDVEILFNNAFSGGATVKIVLPVKKNQEDV